MSQTVEKHDEQDRSTQKDVVAATSASKRVTSAAHRHSVETPGGSQATTSELPWIEFSVKIICNLSAPCELKSFI